MKLLFDENISRRIIMKISHIGKVLFSYIEIWDFAKSNDFIIVTYDENFTDIQMINGFPPILIWLGCGNTKISSIVEKVNKLK